jgi:hypothetical protein
LLFLILKLQGTTQASEPDPCQALTEHPDGEWLEEEYADSRLLVLLGVPHRASSPATNLSATLQARNLTLAELADIASPTSPNSELAGSSWWIAYQGERPLTEEEFYMTLGLEKNAARVRSHYRRALWLRRSGEGLWAISAYATLGIGLWNLAGSLGAVEETPPLWILGATVGTCVAGITIMIVGGRGEYRCASHYSDARALARDYNTALCLRLTASSP